MKHLLTALVVFCGMALGENTAANGAAPEKVSAAQKGVSQCFKVHRLLKTDSTHYWADWTNTCSYTIDAVYVMVGFRDSSLREMGNGVWPMYFVEPGVHRVTRFSAPVADFETIHVHQITTDSVLALRGDPGPALPGSATAASVIPNRAETETAQMVADTSVGQIIGASGQPLPAKVAVAAPKPVARNTAAKRPVRKAAAKRPVARNHTKY